MAYLREGEKKSSAVFNGLLPFFSIFGDYLHCQRLIEALGVV
jgi:hypothetical protein